MNTINLLDPINRKTLRSTVLEERKVHNEATLYNVTFESEGMKFEVPVIIYPDGSQFTPSDWDTPYPETDEAIIDIRWMSQDGRLAVMMDGLPRLIE